MSELEVELRELERTDPDVRAASEAIDALTDYIARTERWKAARRAVQGHRSVATGQFHGVDGNRFTSRPPVSEGNTNHE